MAYAQSAVTMVSKVIGGRNYIIASFTETDLASSSEWSISGLPSVVTLVSFKVTLTAGSGATLNPKLFKATGASVSTQNHLGTQSSTAAHISDQTVTILPIGTGGVLYGKNTPNAGTDNAASTELVLVEGVLS